MKTTTEHIVCVQSDLSLLCLHCSERYRPTMPMALADYTALGKSFTKRHRRCKPRCSTCEHLVKTNSRDGGNGTMNTVCELTDMVIWELHTHRCRDYKPRPVEQ